MAKRNCPACNTALENNVSSSGHCLACGHDLAVSAPPPGWKIGKLDLRSIARRQRHLLWIILASVIAQFCSIVGQNAFPWSGLVFLLLVLLLNLCSIVCVVHLQAAQGVHMAWRVVTIILLFAPCVNLLVLLVVNGRATTTLQRTGLKVGFMGVSDDRIMRFLSGNLCKRCGYLLVGAVSERCPECGEPMGVSQRSGQAVTGESKSSE